MSIEKMFETATRKKMRFPFRGLISIEDLWDLTVENLDSIFKTLNSQFKQVKEESLLNKKTQKDEELELQIELVKYIVKIKLDESSAQMKAKENHEQKQKIMQVIAAKQDTELHNKSIGELQDMINKLNN